MSSGKNPKKGGAPISWNPLGDPRAILRVVLEAAIEEVIIALHCLKKNRHKQFRDHVSMARKLVLEASKCITGAGSVTERFAECARELQEARTRELPFREHGLRSALAMLRDCFELTL